MSEALVGRSPTRAFFIEWQRGLEWPLLAAASLLIGLGLLMSLAAGPTAAARLGFDDPFYFTKRHAVFAAAAMIVLLSSSLVDRVWARRLSALVFFVALVLLVVTVFAGYESKGAQRWIRMAGMSLQPSEFVKPTLIVLIAWLLSQRQMFPEVPWVGIALVPFCLAIGLLLLQPDVGQSALLTAAFFVTFFISGIERRLALHFAGVALAVSTLAYAVFPHVRYRVNSFFNPTAYDTYQIDKAQEAITRGGLVGMGPGEGRIKTQLPDAHTDFIFAVIGEEFGFLALLGVILLFGFILWRGFKLVARMHDPYPRAAAGGLFALFGLQAAINIAVNVSLVPPKGMTLPFVSYGGSSMMGTALTLGLALALIRRGSLSWTRND